MDIELVVDTARFHKKLWHDSELLLARCFNFSVDIETGFIEAYLPKTSKRSMFEFIRLAFKNFSESPLEEGRREAFYQTLTHRYTEYNHVVDEQIDIKLPYAKNLYSHQRDTLKESYYKQFNFYALDMGLGKTLTSASLSRLHKCRRTVIFCPAAVKWNWFRDLKHFGFNELFFSIFDSKKARTVQAFNERFVIINYDIISNFEKQLLSAPIDHFILDEAHALKNHNSQRFKKLHKIIEANPTARITFLSGTPIKNRVNDAFAYLKLIGHELGLSYKKFLDEYTISTTGSRGLQIKGGRNLQDLQVKLTNLMIRKTKEQCLDLPEKIFLQYKYEMADYRAEYDKVIEELSQQKSISSLTGNLHSLNIITSKAKIPGIIEIAENIIEEGRKVVIFGGYTDPIETLEKHFGKACVKVTGSVDSFTRDQHVQRFHNDPECTVFLGNMVAAGVGINLTNASDVIFMNFPLTPAELYQAMDRLHRIGQKSSVNVHYTFCEESIDEYVYEILMDKEKDINALVDNGKEVMIRDNIAQILISKLLNKNVDIEITDADIHGVEAQEKVEEVRDVVETERNPVENIFARKNREREEILLPTKQGNGERPNYDNRPIASDVFQESTFEQGFLFYSDKPNTIDLTSIREKEERSQNIMDKWIMSEGAQPIKEDVKPKYYVVYNVRENLARISNQEELAGYLTTGNDILFSHEDPQQCIIHGTHYQLTRTLSFDRNYTRNGSDIEVPPGCITAAQHAEIGDGVNYDDLPDFD